MTVPLPPAPWHAHACGCHHCHVWRKHRAKQMAAENEQASLDFGGAS